MKHPSISVVFAALNSGSVIGSCLRSIAEQDYPQEMVEVIVADGGSTDNTVAIAKKYKAKVINNPLRTSESGKAEGVRKAKGELIAFIDSDNILPSKSWFKQMVAPFSDTEIIASEPIEYTHRPSDPILTRYFALLGMNDPICYFLGNYDRLCTLSGKWTGLKFRQEDQGEYLKIRFDHEPLPTVGANGTLIRREVLRKYWQGKYLFDIDVLVDILRKSGPFYFAKVKVGIVHTYVETDPFKFFRKQLRRVSDMMYHQSKGSRSTDWQKIFFLKIMIFQLECVLVLPILWQTVFGFVKKPDRAWFFHPIAVYSTWFIYLYGFLKGKIFPAESSRVGWKQ